jgi:hypothetical protein
MVMSRDEERRRVPTSDELEELGVLASSAGEPGAPRRGGLRRFFRASRIRVSDDVAARKHVGGAQPHRPVRTAVEAAEEVRNEPDPTIPPQSEESRVAADPPRSPDAIIPRTIRMDPSVRDRRGLGRSGNNTERL